AGAVRPCRPPAAVRRSRPRIAPASRARRPGRDRGRTGAEGPDSPDPGRPPRSWPGRIRTLARPSEAPLSQEILVEQDVSGQWYWDAGRRPAGGPPVWAGGSGRRSPWWGCARDTPGVITGLIVNLAVGT